jgi:hypothetical protein
MTDNETSTAWADGHAAGRADHAQGLLNMLGEIEADHAAGGDVPEWIGTVRAWLTEELLDAAEELAPGPSAPVTDRLLQSSVPGDPARLEWEAAGWVAALGDLTEVLDETVAYFGRAGGRGMVPTEVVLHPVYEFGRGGPARWEWEIRGVARTMESGRG